MLSATFGHYADEANVEPLIWVTKVALVVLNGLKTTMGTAVLLED